MGEEHSQGAVKEGLGAGEAPLGRGLPRPGDAWLGRDSARPGQFVVMELPPFPPRLGAPAGSEAERGLAGWAPGNEGRRRTPWHRICSESCVLNAFRQRILRKKPPNGVLIYLPLCLPAQQWVLTGTSCTKQPQGNKPTMNLSFLCLSLPCFHKCLTASFGP